MRRLLFAVLISLSLSLATAAVAQNTDETTSSSASVPTAASGSGERDGLVIGMGVFAGNGLESDASVAAGMGIQIGWMLNPRLAIMLDTHGAAVGSSQVTATDVSSSVRVRAVAAPSIQWWATKRFWLRGGIGLGQIEGATTAIGIVPTAEIEETKKGLGASIATGFELYQGPLFALDVHARYATVQADGTGYSTVLFGLGFVWYP